MLPTEMFKWNMAFIILGWETVYPEWSNRNADDVPVVLANVVLNYPV